MKKFWKRVGLFLVVVALVTLVVHFFHPRLIPSAYAAMLPKNNRTEVKTSKIKSCEEFTTHAWQLNDSVHQYLEHSYLNGMGGFLKFAREIQPKIDSGKLVLIENNQFYMLDTLHYSYPFLTPKGANLLAEIGTKFQTKLKNTHLKNTRFVVTSMLRTVSSVSRLRRRNRNAIRRSAHLHGTTFDITYEKFDNPQLLSAAENYYLKEMLAQSIFELREEKKCWATYEMWQTCFHIVSR